eukprot:s2585_g6.t1
MLWAGFYDGDPRGLNQTALEAFADMVDRSIVHPSTILGKVLSGITMTSLAAEAIRGLPRLALKDGACGTRVRS